MNTRRLLIVLMLASFALLLAACAGPAGPAGPAGESVMADLTCKECHNDTAIITSKKAAWQISIHGSGEAFAEEGGRNACAFCHSGSAFSAAVAAGQNFAQVQSGDAEPTHQDCRTCHQIHVTYTSADWALETDAAVTMVTSGVTFDGGAGNLCANCHQARRYLANFVDKTDPTKYAASIGFNTHYSVQADVLVGAGDFGVTGEPSAHYTDVQDTCVGCHMGEKGVHTFEPQLAVCQQCHEGATNFDVNGYLTTFEARYAELEAALKAKGLINEDGSTVAKNPDGSTVLLDPGPAQALFFYNLVHEDGSEGLHNPAYFTALMGMALEALK